jgi:hypothetical protein
MLELLWSRRLVTPSSTTEHEIQRASPHRKAGTVGMIVAISSADGACGDPSVKKKLRIN